MGDVKLECSPNTYLSENDDHNKANDKPETAACQYEDNTGQSRSPNRSAHQSAKQCPAVELQDHLDDGACSDTDNSREPIGNTLKSNECISYVDHR